MWKRFNIAEPAIHKMIEKFETHETAIKAVEDVLPMADLADALGDDWKELYAKQKPIYEKWIVDLNAWFGSCYPMPDDRRVQISDQICLYGIDSRTIADGIKDAKSMWKDVYQPLIKEYKNHPNYDADVYSANYQKLKDAIWTVGDPHSFRCEWLFVQSRVRYFEVIPMWEIERVRDDFETDMNAILEFRNYLVVDNPKVLQRSRYESDEKFEQAQRYLSDETMEEMKSKVAEIRDFLKRWDDADSSVYDADLELHRKKTRREMSTCADAAKKIYDWYWMMAFQQMRWKDGYAHDHNSSTGYDWSDSIAREARTHARTHSGRGIKKTARELEKFLFHLQYRV